MSSKKIAKMPVADSLFNDAEQLALVEMEPPIRKITPLPIPQDADSQREHVILENKYADLLEHRLDWRRLVTYVPNKGLPVYNWFKYKEGFSRELVVRLFREFGLQK